MSLSITVSNTGKVEITNGIGNCISMPYIVFLAMLIDKTYVKSEHKLCHVPLIKLFIVIILSV